MRRAAKDVMINLAVLLAYFAAARLGLSLAVVHQSTTAVWPATGIALAAALLLGWRVWPGIWLAAVLANYTVSLRFWPSLGIATGNLLEALVGAALVTQFANGKRAFESAGDIFRFALYAGIIGTAVSATVGVSVLQLSHMARWEDYGPIWLTWWLGDMAGAITVAPLLIIWLATPPPRNLAISEAAALLSVTVAVALIIFSPITPPRIPIGYFSLLPLLWAAFRFHQHGAVTIFFVTAAIATAGTLSGSGPFALEDRHLSLLFLQAYLGTMSVTSLVLAAIVAERQAARREAEAANRAKDNFLAVLSHELRTPLTPALLMSSLLEQRNDLPPGVQQDLQTIRRNIELEARLIDDLLDLTRIARGKLQLNMEQVDLHGAVRGALQICVNGRANIAIDLSAQAATVHGDAARLQQVFWNLLSNAQKFTPNDSRILVRSFNPSPGHVRVEVSDDGIGIDPAVLPRLFNAFEQGETSMTRTYGGLGLGLAISKALVTAHGGTLTAVSEGKGRGATFTVELTTV